MIPDLAEFVNANYDREKRTTGRHRIASKQVLENDQKCYRLLCCVTNLQLRLGSKTD